MTHPFRLLALPALASLVLVAAGCGDDDNTTTTQSRSTTVTRTTPAPEERTRSTAAGDQGGAQVQAGAGSALLGAPAEAGVANASNGLRPFAENSPWNTVVRTDAIDRRSADWLRLVKVRRGVEERPGRDPVIRPRTVNEGIYVNTRGFTTPVVDETDGVATRVVCRQAPIRCGDGPTVDTLQIPPDTDPDPAYDGWFTVLDRARGVAYDMWRARRAPGTAVMSYQFMRKWDLNGPGFLEPGVVSARGSGLPLFAGLILPEEIQAGRIDHALAISLPGPAQRRYVQPASSTDGNGSVDSLPEGARIRLKASVPLRVNALDSRTNQRAARAIYEALRRYGAIVVDRAAVPTLYAKKNYDWTGTLKDAQGRQLDADGTLQSRFLRNLPNQGTPMLRGSEVSQFNSDDFEVVQTRGNLLNFPPLGTEASGTLPSAANPLTQTSSRG